MQRLLLYLLTVSLLSGCSPEAIRARQWKRYLKDLKEAPPVPPDTTTGSYQPSEELDILDQLLRKYPGRQTVRVVTKTETKTLPGKTVYVEVQARPDTVRNRTERDSLLRTLETLVQRERADSELRAELARLRASLLQAFNRRACLPDTSIYIAKYDLTVTIKRGQNNRYGITYTEGARKVSFDTQVTEQQNLRVIYTDRVFWRDKWFWLMVAFGSLTVWLTFLRLRDAAPR